MAQDDMNFAEVSQHIIDRPQDAAEDMIDFLDPNADVFGTIIAFVIFAGLMVGAALLVLKIAYSMRK